jgi:hypothetical protein
MPIRPIYVDEPCPLDGYDDLSVKVLANASDAEWRQWAAARLETPGCPKCNALRQPKVVRGRRKAAALPVTDAPRAFCPDCAAARQRYGEVFVRFYGPELLGHDVSTPGAVLTLLDDDTALPSEIVIWLQVAPNVVRERREAVLLGNYLSSATTPTR